MDPDETYPCRPLITGRLWITTHLEEGHDIAVDIVGDPEGLRSLGDLLISVADADQEAEHTPRGEHYHVHLRPKRAFGLSGHLGATSCKVELCRADASGTGDIYPHLEQVDREAFGFESDTNTPSDWLSRAAAALDLAHTAAAGSPLQRQQAPALASQGIFCALMAGLRTLRVSVPALLEWPTELTYFVPDELELPFEIDEIDDYLLAGVPVPALSYNPLPTEDEISRAVEAGDHMLKWAEGMVSADNPANTE